MSIPVLVTVRFSSSRLPGKCLLEVEGSPILQHLVQRLRHSNFEPVICTTLDSSDDQVVALAQNLGIKFFRGSLLNKIDRWADCARFLGVPVVHILDADDPFVDTDEISASITLAIDLNLDLLRTSEKSDSGFASVGMTIRSEFLQELKLRVKNLKSQDLDVIPWELLLSEKDNVMKLPDKQILEHSDYQLRLTLDYPEDFHLISTVIQNLGSLAGRKSIEEYLCSNPEVLRINSMRTADFLNNKKVLLQKNFNTQTGAIDA
jgi:spore coat polysaccharide biosynthesis protein SpsF (cytidylyltransferase family)